MARDYTKYTVKGLGENLNKRQLVFEIVKDYVEKNKPSYDELTSIFKDEVQGNKFIRKSSDIKDSKRFNTKIPLKIKYGIEVVVSNQWGLDNIDAFLNLAKQLSYSITLENKEAYEKADDKTSSHSSKSNNADSNSYIFIRAVKDNEDFQLIDCEVFESHGEFALSFTLENDRDGYIDSWYFFDTKRNIYGEASGPWGFENGFLDEGDEWTDYESLEELGYDSNEIGDKLDKMRVEFIEKYLTEKFNYDLGSASISSKVINLFKEDSNNYLVFEIGDKQVIKRFES